MREGTDTGNKSLAPLVGLMVAWVILVAIAVPAGATGADESPRGQVRAAFIYNFCKFVEWPPPPQSELPVIVLDDEGGSSLMILAGKQVRDVPISVRQVTELTDATGCRLLYVALSQIDRWDEIQAELDGTPVLTISEMDDFCERGGMIQLVEKQGRLRFFINKGAAEKAGLKISSQLLKMAKIVEGGS